MKDRIKFNSQEEFAEAMIDNMLEDEDGLKYSFEPNNYPNKPFRISDEERSDVLYDGWTIWKTQTFTIVKKSKFPDKAYVWCWNNKSFHMQLRFWDKKNDSTFSVRGTRNGHSFDNYELFEGTPPKHMEEMKKRLED